MKFEDFSMTYEESNNQSDTFFNSLIRYDVTIKYNNREIEIEYQYNPLYAKVKLTDVLDCLVSDAYAYWNSDAFDFMEEFGYDDLKKTKETYYRCKENFEKLCYLVDGTDNLKELNALLEETF